MKIDAMVYPVGDPETMGIVIDSQRDKSYVQWSEGYMDDGWYADNSLVEIEA